MITGSRLILETQLQIMAIADTRQLIFLKLDLILLQIINNTLIVIRDS